MRQTAHTKNRAETRTLLAATLACYLVGFACVFALSYSLAALAALDRAGLHVGMSIDSKER